MNTRGARTQWRHRTQTGHEKENNVTQQVRCTARPAHRASCVASSMTRVSGDGGASDHAQKDHRHGKSPRWKPCAFLQ